MQGPPGPCGCGCALTPETSDGFDQIEFAADVVCRPFDPWQRWLVIHAGELLPDGSLRFRHVLVVVARQNGKSEVPIVLGLFWIFVDEVPCMLWTSTQLKYADAALAKAERYARASPRLRDLIPTKKWKRVILGSSVLPLADSEWWTATANEEGGRSMTTQRLVQDELREHRDYAAWGAAVPTLRPSGQAWHLSNAGEDHSVVLNEQQDAARKAIADGTTAEVDTFLAEWSSVSGADPMDLGSLAQSNPGLGYHGPSARDLLGEARTAVAAGGQALAKFRTEKMCIRVRHLDAAVDEDSWTACGVDEQTWEATGSLAAYRRRVVGCLDVSPDGLHATLAAAAVVEGEVARVEIVQAWSGAGAMEQLRAALPAWIKKVRPKALGWFPAGPAAALVTELGKRRDGQGRSPLERVMRRKPEPIKADVSAVCMAFSAEVLARRVAHPEDDLLTAHVVGSEKLRMGDTWRFSRRGEGHCDAAYAAAGAVHLARMLPTPVRGGIVLPSSAAPDGDRSAT